MTRYISLAEYFWLAEQVTGLEAAVLVKAARADLADSALHAPRAGFGDTEFYPDVFDKAAVLTMRRGFPRGHGNASTSTDGAITRYGMCKPLMLRATTNRWISLVPSKIV